MTMLLQYDCGLVVVVPILILYVFLQKYIVEGVTSGTVKG